MSHNLGQKSHCMDQSETHTKLTNQIADIKSLLDNSTQKTKELKAQLNELTEKEKDTGKSPQNIQAPSNRFNTLIPKIQGLFINTMLPATVNNITSGLSSDMQSKDQITSECNAQICDRTQDLVPSHVFLSEQPLDFDSEMPSNSGFETPSESFDFDLDLFSEMQS